MFKQIPGEITEKLIEQAKHTGQAAKQAPKTVFQRMVGEKTDEEKKQEKEAEELGLEDTSSGQQTQQPLTQTDVRRRELEKEKELKRRKMRNILHKRLFAEAEKVRRRKEEGEKLTKMKEEEEKRKREEYQMDELKLKEKEEALAVRYAKRAKGAGEFGPKPPK